jgi:hypothetical protein
VPTINPAAAPVIELRTNRLRVNALMAFVLSELSALSENCLEYGLSRLMNKMKTDQTREAFADCRQLSIEN